MVRCGLSRIVCLERNSGLQNPGKNPNREIDSMKHLETLQDSRMRLVAMVGNLYEAVPVLSPDANDVLREAVNIGADAEQ